MDLQLQKRVKEIAAEIAESPDDIKFVESGTDLIIPDTLATDPSSVASGKEKGRDVTGPDGPMGPTPEIRIPPGREEDEPTDGPGPELPPEEGPSGTGTSSGGTEEKPSEKETGKYGGKGEGKKGGKGEGKGEGEGEEEDVEDMDDMDDMDDMGGEEEIEGEEEEEDEDINLEELLAEINSMEEETSMEEGVFTGIKNLAKKMVGKLTDEQKKNREELIQATEKQVKAAKLDNGQPITAQSFLTYKEGDGDDLRTQIIKWVDSENADAITTNFKGKFDIRSGSEGGIVLVWKPEYSTFQKATMGASGAAGSQVGAKQSAFEVELEEAYAAIAELRNELNEVNLLNAKLLYTNKIFKAKNLTESEKIKVLNTFDKAETVKEVKLVFETLTESFKATTAKKNTIKESLGSASKTISTATPKQPIIETNEAFARMQRLAGLRK